MKEFDPRTSVLQAKLQAWCATLLSIVVDAYQLGAVLGRGALVAAADGDALAPDVAFIPIADRAIAGPDSVKGAPGLAIDILFSRMPEPERAELRQRYAGLGVLEYWQIEADTAQAALYQANAAGEYDLILPDKVGMHFSAAIPELSFPVRWFREQPGVWTILQRWGMIRD